MRLRLGIVLLLCLGLSKGGFSRRVEWADTDTIIVEATREEDVANVLFQRRHDFPFFYHSPMTINYKSRGDRDKMGTRGRTGRAFIHTCYSVLGDQGRCTTFQECFPMLYYTDGEHSGQIKHPVLADLLMSTSGPCQPPPLSFRDDFVPYEGLEEEAQMEQYVFNLNKKDLICCPSTKPTAIPPSGEYSHPQPSLPPMIERVSMRTTPSTSTTPEPWSPTPDKNEVYESAPDAVAGFAQAPSKVSSKPSRPKPAQGQLGHRIPTKSTTTPKPKENDISYSESESDESEEEVKPKPTPSKVKVTSSKPAKVQGGGDATVPAKVAQARPTRPTSNPNTPQPEDISVPVFNPHPRPTNVPKRPSTTVQSNDVYVPVIPMGTMEPDDSVVVNNPTPSTLQPSSESPEVVQREPADAVAGVAVTIESSSTTTEEPITTTTLASTTTHPTPSYPPHLLGLMQKTPCGTLNSSTDPKHPWVAAIKLGEKFICAGSLIDEYHVMTAASCVAHLSTIDIGRLRVYLGERILNSNIDGPTIVRRVLRAMRHRGFSITTLRNDIALLKLSLPIPLGTKRVRPVCLPLDEDKKLVLETSLEASVVGWGSHWNQIQNDVTHESRLTIWSKDACLDKYRYFIPDSHFDDEDMLCAQHSTKHTIQSLQNKPKILPNLLDEDVETDGSPLIVRDKNGIYQQIGISSWKLGSLSNFPRVLTRVSAYRDWIEKNRSRP